MKTFNSLEELLQRVTEEEIVELIQMGFKVYEIQANQVISSNFQSIFKEENIIEKNNISSIFQ